MPRQQALGDAIGDRFELVVAEPSVPQIAVAVGPGDTMFRRTSSGANSAARVRICAASAALLAI